MSYSARVLPRRVIAAAARGVLGLAADELAGDELAGDLQ